MTARDTWQAARSALAAKRALIEAGTPGPWFVEFAGDFSDRKALVCDVLREKYGNNALDFGEDHRTASLTVAAVNDYLPLLDIALGTLDLHSESECYPTCRSVHLCNGCAEDWPCASVRPVLTFAGVEVGA